MITVSKFESPAGEYEALSELNLHDLVVGQHRHAVFFSWAAGDNLRSVGIYDNDLLVANRAQTAENEDVVIALVHGEFVARVFDRVNGLLLSDNEPPVSTEGIVIEAVVTQSLRCHRRVRR